LTFASGYCGRLGSERQIRSTSVAVLDIGKTNVKVLVFDAQGSVIAERSRANRSLPADAHCPYLHLDTEGTWSFLIEALREMSATTAIDAISVSTHGAAGVLVDATGIVLPPVDYEWEGLEIDAEAYAAVRPSFDETLSPNMPRGLNLGRHLFYVYRHHAREAGRAQAFLTYPQYWSWRLCGVMASELTSLGCHTDLWRPGDGRFSSLVDRQGWAGLFPPLRRAWEKLGPVTREVAELTGLARNTQVLCGVHDSNAALVPYLMTRSDPFTLISTGTWVVIIAVGGQAAPDAAADMLANVNVRGQVVPSARFMGGREFATIAGGEPAEIGAADLAAVVASGSFALPSFADQGGPFAGRVGRIEGPIPATPGARTALAALYVALMTAHLVERLKAPGELIVEGGLARSNAFAGLLAGLMPDRSIVVAESAAGAAEGAALLAHWGESIVPPRTRPAPAWSVAGLDAYRARWSALTGV
jgi:L-fuculokinase